jgi:Co/Zn/Cd efflux system component
MGHNHVHAVAHFPWCTHPDSCLCEPERYVLAAFVGVVFASLEWWISTAFAGSYGGETDAVHAFADSGFILTSALLALWKRSHVHQARRIDDIGMWMNNLSFIAAGVFILYKLVAGSPLVAFTGGAMFAAGFVGLVGNVLQFKSLGEKLEGEGTYTHSANRSHVFYDTLNSGTVMLGAGLAIVMTADVPMLLRVLASVMLCLIAALSIVRFRLVEYESWPQSRRLDYWLGVMMITGILSFVVAGGSPGDIDLVIGFTLAVAMIVGGLANLYRRYFPKKGSHAHHGHEH